MAYASNISILFFVRLNFETSIVRLYSIVQCQWHKLSITINEVYD